MTLATFWLATPSDNRFRRLDYNGVRQRIAGYAGQGGCRFLGCDPATTCRRPRRPAAGRICRGDDCLCQSENVLFRCTAGDSDAAPAVE